MLKNCQNSQEIKIPVVNNIINTWWYPMKDTGFHHDFRTRYVDVVKPDVLNDAE